MASRKQRSPGGNDVDGVASFRVQNQIRRNAQDMQDYISDLGNWERSIKKKDRQLSRKASNAAARAIAGSPPIRSSKVPVSMSTSPKPQTPGGSNADEIQCSSSRRSGSGRGGDVPCAVNQPQTMIAEVSAAEHTHDKGYDKWAKFDVDAALRSIDGEDGDGQKKKGIDGNSSSDSDTNEGFHEIPKRTSRLTPATMVDRSDRRAVPSAPLARDSPSAATTTRVTAAVVSKDLEKEEREKGNSKFVRGDFEGAVKCYTRCLGINSKSFLAFSNRSMAYLKLKEFGKAEADGDTALGLDPRHVKSLQRRAAARNALGKHRAALADLQNAAEIDPSSKEIRKDLSKTLETLKTAVRRAPKTRVKVVSAPLPAPRPLGYIQQNDGETSLPPPAPPSAGASEVAAGAPDTDSSLTLARETPAPFCSVSRGTSDHHSHHGLVSPVIRTTIEELGVESSAPQDVTQGALSDAVHAEHPVTGETVISRKGQTVGDSIARAGGDMTSQSGHRLEVIGSLEASAGEVSLSAPSASERAAIPTPPSADADVIAAFPADLQEAASLNGRDPPSDEPMRAPRDLNGTSVVRRRNGSSPEVAHLSGGAPAQNTLAKKRTVEKTKAPIQRSTSSMGTVAPGGTGTHQQAPTTGYQFEQMWRSTEGSKEARLELLRTVQPSSVAKIFRRTPLEVELLGGVLCHLEEAFLPRRPVTALRWLKSLSKASRFGMTVALLGKAPGRTAVRELLVRLQSAPHEKVDPLELENLKIMFLV